jgi:hypothetical protein
VDNYLSVFGFAGFTSVLVSFLLSVFSGFLALSSFLGVVSVFFFSLASLR